ncbi:response regulator [Frigoriglobus tundricola]|uniref:Chemotaxis protein methyltransferase CheR n=1 Tax=Frigoriglobus tundricola TaxID=2774151 RepID=A0A6M5Z375_9BACT|nr:response regulator [Frigoriglobus tundricola]QJX00870.1 Chemotaxis protein methyltransferase CheR [Frigoriglobus tundricola]
MTLVTVHTRPRVLCVDDNHDVADSAADLLDLHGFETRVCYDGQTALTLVVNFAPDICLIDLNMPGMDGDQVAAQLRDVGRPVVLVAVTAASDDRARRRIAAAGFDLHLVKPVDPRQLPTILTSIWPKMSEDAPGS